MEGSVTNAILQGHNMYSSFPDWKNSRKKAIFATGLKT
jgi:hypothetical protein